MKTVGDGWMSDGKSYREESLCVRGRGKPGAEDKLGKEGILEASAGNRQRQTSSSKGMGLTVQKKISTTCGTLNVEYWDFVLKYMEKMR